MGCVSSKSKGLRIDTFSTKETTSGGTDDQYLHDEDTLLVKSDSSPGDKSTYNVLHIKELFVTDAKRPTSPLAFLSYSLRTSFTRPISCRPHKSSLIQLLLSNESLFRIMLQFLGTSHILARLCGRFNDHIFYLESKQEKLLSCITDIEEVECRSEYSLDDEGVSCYSSILEGENNWSRPPSAAQLTQASPSEQQYESSPVLWTGMDTNDTDTGFFWRNDWLPTPFHHFEYLLTTNNNTLGENVPAIGEMDTVASSGVILPSHLVLQHHQNPHQTSIHLPKLKYPGTIVAVSSFTHLQHLAIGCIGFQPDCSVTDYDMAVVVDCLGEQLQSVRLIKLNGLSTASLAMISATCVQLTILVVFGCEGMRLKERNNMNIQRAFNSFENQPGACPRVFVPLTTPLPHVEDDIFSQDRMGGVEQIRRLDLLDLRYSIDLNDTILTEIMNEFNEIGIFLGANMHITTPPGLLDDNKDKYSECRGGGASHCDVDLEISDDCWNSFKKHYSDKSDLLYIDDFTRERNTNFELLDPSQTPVLLFSSSSITISTTCRARACKEGGQQSNMASSCTVLIDSVENTNEESPESVWARTPFSTPHSPSSPPETLSSSPSLWRLREKVLASLPTYVDPDFFSTIVPGSE